ncbi:conserved hypothetical protein [Candida tropicalis MYA-3404]|uniref:Uncharacterized protein n=1 Tax=Candida tropicalis (strain ATCC MYA-3404 / T1) TaxID=294747 RepID=C5M1Y5_CANTT|nr:conserved hypothetical protein [Candida tropicalis MYA-3404]EER35335.1 conserved hypothetical protein [Candida tropicalis MYA-3404]KAG4409438.1 hypothetical protein JTP64_000076 [Candida tropicalis]
MNLEGKKSGRTEKLNKKKKKKLYENIKGHHCDLNIYSPINKKLEFIMSHQEEIESPLTSLQPDIQPQTTTTTSTSKSKKKKQRKPQTEEEYAFQVSRWNETGPTINTDTWLFENLEELNVDVKIDRLKLLHAVELAYYQKDYEKCLELLKLGEKMYNVDFDEVGECITNDYKNSQKQVKWNKKVERNIMELYNIKKKCINKLG